MSYYSYHNTIKNKIKKGLLVDSFVTNNYHGISPALVLVFSDGKSYPIRQYHWAEYFELIEK